MLANYRFRRFVPSQRTKFERHLGDCVACSAAVVTARSLRAAVNAEKNDLGVAPVR